MADTTCDSRRRTGDSGRAYFGGPWDQGSADLNRAGSELAIRSHWETTLGFVSEEPKFRVSIWSGQGGRFGSVRTDGAAISPPPRFLL